MARKIEVLGVYGLANENAIASENSDAIVEKSNLNRYFKTNFCPLFALSYFFHKPFVWR